jgi:hypothetical protein
MLLHETWKKIMTGALAFTLVTGSGTALLSTPVPVSAEEAVSTKALPFTDMPNGHWAEKHVAKLSFQGVITGYYDKNTDTYTFRPEKSISQQEAVLLALRFAGLDDLADEDSLIVFGEKFTVGEFYKKYIELAFSEGLLDRDEEYQLAAADPDTEWGSKPASREWVTKLIVKAIGQEAAASQLENAPSHFTDANDVQVRYKGYVNAAYQLGLIKGLTDTEFAPKNAINRASLATLFSRAQTSFPMDYPGQISGVVSDLGEDAITIYDVGEEMKFTLDANTLYYHYNSEKAITKDQLLEYGDVSVIAKDGKALFVEVLGDVQHTDSISGTFARYNEASKIFYLWIDDKPVEIQYSDAMRIEDTDGKVLTLADIKANAAVTVVREAFGESPQAISLVVAAEQAVTLMSGDFYSADSKTVTITKDGELVSKFLAIGATVEISGLANAAIGDLIPGSDKVEVSLNDEGQVTKIKVLNRDVKVLAGARIVYYDKAEKFVTVVGSDKQRLTLDLTDKTIYNYLGTTMDREAAMALINTNVNVVIKHTGANAVSVNFVMNYAGTITEIDTAAKSITVLTSEGYTVKIPYTVTGVEWYSRPTATLADLKTGDSVTVAMKMDKVEAASIRVHRTIAYDVVSVDVANKKMVIKNAVNDSVTLTLTNVKMLKPDGTNALISTYRAGDKVEVSYIGNTVMQVQEVNTNSGSNG